MLSYQYRWLYVFLVTVMCLLTAFFYDLKPLHKEWVALIVREKKLIQEWQTTQQFLLQQTSPYFFKEANILRMQQTELLTHLLMQAGRYHLTVQAVNAQANKWINTFEESGINIVIQGSFQQLTAFLLALNHHTSQVWVSDFIYKLSTQNHLLLTMDILPFGKRQEQMDFSNQAILDTNTFHNPFCFIEEGVKNASQDDALLLQSVPLRQIKMAGYFAQQNERQALVRLPSARLMLVGLGAWLGLEKGRVMAIEEKRIVTMLPNKQAIFLQR